MQNLELIALIGKLSKLDRERLFGLFEKKFLRKPELQSNQEIIKAIVMYLMVEEVINKNDYIGSGLLNDAKNSFAPFQEGSELTRIEKIVDLEWQKRSGETEKPITQKSPKPVYVKDSELAKRSWQEKREEIKVRNTEEIEKNGNPVIWGRPGSAERIILTELKNGSILSEIAFKLIEKGFYNINEKDRAFARVRSTFYHRIKGGGSGILYKWKKDENKKITVWWDGEFTDSVIGEQTKQKFLRWTEKDGANKPQIKEGVVKDGDKDGRSQEGIGQG